MKVVMVDCLIYRGLPRSARRHAALSPDLTNPLQPGWKRLTACIKVCQGKGIFVSVPPHAVECEVASDLPLWGSNPVGMYSIRLLDWQEKFNKQVNKISCAAEQAIANFKAWRIMHTDYRQPRQHSAEPPEP